MESVNFCQFFAIFCNFLQFFAYFRPIQGWLQVGQALFLRPFFAIFCNFFNFFQFFQFFDEKCRFWQKVPFFRVFQKFTVFRPPFFQFFSIFASVSSKNRFFVNSDQFWHFLVNSGRKLQFFGQFGSKFGWFLSGAPKKRVFSSKLTFGSQNCVFARFDKKAGFSVRTVKSRLFVVWASLGWKLRVFGFFETGMSGLTKSQLFDISCQFDLH